MRSGKAVEVIWSLTPFRSDEFVDTLGAVRGAARSTTARRATCSCARPTTS